MKFIILIITLLSFNISHAQINWKEASNWRLYKMRESVMFSISPDSLSQVKSYPLQSDSIAGFLDMIRPLPAVVKPVWMGGDLITCVYSGKIRKILISNYGGFFLDQMSGTFFQLTAQTKDNWIQYIHGCLLSL